MAIGAAVMAGTVPVPAIRVSMPDDMSTIIGQIMWQRVVLQAAGECLLLPIVTVVTIM